MSDMLDVIHYIFEEDATFTSREHLESRELFRKKMYPEMYNRPYKYFRATSTPSSGISGADFNENEFEDLSPVDPLKPPTKGYVPPTDFDPERPNPFGGVLDAPLG